MEGILPQLPFWVVINVVGIVWLALYVPSNQLVAVGFAPFLLGDLVKIGVVALAAHLLCGMRADLRDSAQ